MVDIRIIIEGGVLPHSNVDAATMVNSERLREAFHKLLSQVIDPELFNLIIEVGAGYKNAAKTFKIYAGYDDKVSLLIDLDGPRPSIKEKLEELEIEDISERVYFMIQAMESWILSQPKKLIRYCDETYIRGKVGIDIIDTERGIFSIHPEEIVKPYEKLKIILGRYYSVKKGSVEKKKKYGKLKDAPLLIGNLDIEELMSIFTDVKSLVFYINSKMIF
jgi:hypothetical protein